MGSIQNLDEYFKILSLGIIGLVFLFALFSLTLIVREQRKEEPSDRILKAINRYMIYSLILCVICIIGRLFEHSYSSDRKSLIGELKPWTIIGKLKIVDNLAIPLGDIDVKIQPPRDDTYTNGRFKIENVHIEDFKNPPSLTIERKGYDLVKILLDNTSADQQNNCKIKYIPEDNRIEITDIILQKKPEQSNAQPIRAKRREI